MVNNLAVIVHSTGINWGQALATWIPIVVGMFAIIAAILGVAKWFRDWQEKRQQHSDKLEAERQQQVQETTERLLQGFAATLNVRFQEVKEHLDTQDRHLTKQDERFDRIDRRLEIDSR